MWNFIKKLVTGSEQDALSDSVPVQNNQKYLPACQTLLNEATKRAGRNLSEDEVYIVKALYERVWAGMYRRDEMLEFIEDQEDGESDLQLIKSIMPGEMARKIEAEKSWPQHTDCDRLDHVFKQLNGQGIVALHHAGYTMSDGLYEVDVAVDQRGKTGLRGFCFYHGQDLERAVHGGGLTLAFGDLDGDDEAMLKIGHEVKKCLEQAAFKVDWDGTADRRITIMNIDWKRRGFGA